MPKGEYTDRANATIEANSTPFLLLVLSCSAESPTLQGPQQALEQGQTQLAIG